MAGADGSLRKAYKALETVQNLAAVKDFCGFLEPERKRTLSTCVPEAQKNAKSQRRS